MSPNPSSCKHYQAIERVDGANGVPFLLVTRSGNLPDTFPFADVFCDDSPGETGNGHLIVFKMGSRDRNGERLRSNRLQKGEHVNGTAPSASDVATVFFTVVEGGLVPGNNGGVVPPRGYQHPGGMQLIGHTLALAVEAPRDPLAGCVALCLSNLACAPYVDQVCRENDTLQGYDVASSPTMIMFFDVRDPENPIFVSQFPPVDAGGTPLTKAGFVGVTPLPPVPGEDSGRYLAVTAGGSHPDSLFFYRSSPGDISSPLSWNFLATADYPNVADAHQVMQFLRQGDIHGDLYLAGVRGNANTVLHDDRDKIDLRRVVCTDPSTGQEDPLCLPGDEISLALVFPSRLITPRPSTGGTRLVNLAAASGFYVSPTGELIMYATEHDNDGPDGTVKAGEWRHINMAREDSPTMRPSILLNTPFVVNEGGTTDLRGRAEPPIVQPWIELFHDTDFGGDHFSTIYPVVDYPDYALDDFDNFFALEYQITSINPPTLLNLNDKARSWKYFAPVGCSIATLDYEDNQIQTRILPGTGLVEEDADLSQLFPDMDQGVDAVEFLSNCDDYYLTEVDLQWDLDGNGSHETTGNVVPFDAAGLDGPDAFDLPVRAQHPFGGPSGQATATVTVLNVAPALTPLILTDSGGNQVGMDVPFVLAGLPVSASAEFTDPGLPDRQTAVLDWGDGTVDSHAAFATFDEAFGDGMGAVRHAHDYPNAGSFSIVLSVADDDGGTGSAVATVEVVTPEQAVEALIDLLDELIASTTNSTIRKDLLKARKALAGNPNGNNGALNKIQNGNDAAAIAFLNQAIANLQHAALLGADVATPIALLQQVVAALQAA